MNNTTKAPNGLLIPGGIVYLGVPGSWGVPGTDNPLIAWPVGAGLILLGGALAVVGVRRGLK